jgi:hypothetical protein
MNENSISISNDLLERSDELNTISKFIDIVKGPYVIAIEGPWGVGKTYFSHLLIDKINDGTQAVYINAWERDFIDDPILTILRGVIKQLEKNGKPIEDIKKKSKKYLKIAYPYLIDSITGGVISKDLIDDLTDNYFKQKDTREELLEDVIILLKKLVSYLDNQKLLIIIDELDRSRPSYAIEFIERIKHLFNIEGVIFLLSINRPQLEKSIRKIYGEDIDSENYLHRFIDFEYPLSLKLNSKFILEKLDRLGITDRLGQQNTQNIANTIKLLSFIFNSTPRDINQVSAQFNLIYESSGFNLNREIHDFYLTLLFINQFSKSFYKDIINFRINSLEIFTHLFEDKFDQKNLNVYRITDLLLPFIKLDKQNTLFKKYSGYGNDYQPSSEKEINLKGLVTRIKEKEDFYTAHDYKNLINTFRFKLHQIG